MTPDTSEDAPLWSALEQSVLGRLTTVVSRPFFTVARESRAIAAGRQLREEWRALAVPARMQIVGAMMIVGSLVHIGLAATRHPVGYWWLIVPGTALMFGLTAVALSQLGRAQR